VQFAANESSVILFTKTHPSKMTVFSFSKPLRLLSTHWKSPIDKGHDSALPGLSPELRGNLNLVAC
jgi:hypothetical protein